MEINRNESEMDLLNEVCRRQREKMDCGMLCMLLFFFLINVKLLPFKTSVIGH